jgi:hypothetical protein
MPVVVLLADGLRADTLRCAMDDGALPAISRLLQRGGLYEITSTFPSVTGPAYTPFLLGRFPGSVGLPGLRWFDRSRRVCSFPGYSRSYVGHGMTAADSDLDSTAPTIFELAPGSAAAMSMIMRGVAPRNRLMALTPRTALRAAFTHFRGNPHAWLRVDRETSRAVVRQTRARASPFVFAAFMGVDKVSHACGQEDARIIDALRIIDETVAELRALPEPPHVWVASDHGHSSVTRHDDLHRELSRRGIRATAHPWMRASADVAVMVSGNAMAHLYVELERRARPFWLALRDRWTHLVDWLLARESVDLVLLRVDHRLCAIRSRSGGAVLSWGWRTYSYERCDGDGDPLRIGRDLRDVDAAEAYEATLGTDHPDAIVQIARIVAAERSGDIILSATRGWDFRERYEPIPHVSAHGALHRDHMLVPLLLDTPVARTPRRTADIMPSALQILGVAPPAELDGQSFL